jgi:hypothetical protein
MAATASGRGQRLRGFGAVCGGVQRGDQADETRERAGVVRARVQVADERGLAEDVDAGRLAGRLVEG